MRHRGRVEREAARRTDEIMNKIAEKRRQQEEENREEARRMLASGSAERVKQRELDGKIAVCIDMSVWRSRARQLLFPEGAPNGGKATHIIKCLSCGNHILYHTGVPFSQTGKLSVLKCKKCWKAIPYANASCQTYDKKAVVSIDEEIEDFAKRLEAQEREQAKLEKLDKKKAEG